MAIHRIEDLLALVALACLLAAILLRRPSWPELARLAVIAAWSFALLLALRFGGRTYPGFWFPDSLVLNRLLNGNRLFTSFGYDLVLIATIAAAIPVVQTPLRRGEPMARMVKWVAIGLAASIAIYGFAVAEWLHRMPWDEY